MLFPVAAASQSGLILNTKNGADSRIISIHTITAVMIKYLVFLGASTGLYQHLTTMKTVKAYKASINIRPVPPIDITGKYTLQAFGRYLAMLESKRVLT